MKEINSRFESELRLSPSPIIVLLAAFAMGVQFVTRNESDTYHRFHLDVFVVLLYTLCAVALLLSRWRSWAGRWFVIISVFQMSCTWFNSFETHPYQ